MAENQEITDLHAAIKAVLEAKYTGYNIYDYEDVVSDSEDPDIDTPAILIEIDDDFENDTEHNESDSTNLTYRLRAYVCMSFTVNKVKLAIKQFTANLTHFINNNTFNNTAEPALVINGSKPIVDINGIEIRAVEWEQKIEITGDGSEA